MKIDTERAAQVLVVSAALLMLASSAGCTNREDDEAPNAESSEETGDAQLPEGCDYSFVGGVDDRDAIQTALSEAPDGSTLCFAGTFEITTDRFTALNKVGITLRGIGEGEGVGAGAIFDFGNTVGPTGMKFENFEGLILEGFTVKNVAGDGIEVRGSTEVVFRDVRITWDAGASTDNGAYAFYPVESNNVLMEGCESSYARDAGVYVGQSTNIVIRDCVAHSNVTGIQVENSIGAEVYDNVTYDNVVGLFVHDLPGVPAGNGGKVWLHDNETYANNGLNFAPEGFLAKLIPTGLGVLIMSMDEVEISNNFAHDNDSAGVLIISFLTVDLLDPGSKDPDPDYDPYPEHHWIHDNTFTDNGLAPAELFGVFGYTETFADIAWDGIADPSKDNADGWLNICIQDNGDAVYANFDTLNQHGGPNSDMSLHDCAHDPLEPVDNGL